MASNSLKTFIIILLSLILGSQILHSEEYPGRLVTETIENQGLTRTYHIYLPTTLKRGAPLVFVLHGYKGDASILKPKRFLELAEEYGYAICYPQGSKDGRGKNCWNVGYPWQIDSMKVDDCRFICDLAAHLSRKYHLSRKNVFLTGMSNGGEMCYLMAYRYPQKFAAIASMAGLTLVDMTERYSYTKPVPFMEVHGTADRTSAWEGDLENKGGWGAYLPVQEAVDAVVKNNGCNFVEHGEVINEDGAHQVLCHYWSRQSEDAATTKCGSKWKPVVLYEVVGGGHNWAMDSFDSPWIIMEFFKNNLR